MDGTHGEFSSNNQQLVMPATMSKANCNQPYQMKYRNAGKKHEYNIISFTFVIDIFLIYYFQNFLKKVLTS